MIVQQEFVTEICSKAIREILSWREEWLDKVHHGNCLELLPKLPAESVDLCMFSPPYYGLRDYGETTVTMWGGDSQCKHEWIEERMTLVHENRNFLRGTQEDVHGKKSTTYIKKYDDKKAGFCVKCNAWRGQLGLEPSWQLYIEHMVMVCREIKRVLKKTGSMYIVLGDSYAGSHCGSHDYRERQPCGADVKRYQKEAPQAKASLPAKCLIGVPWRLAFALIDDGWVLRGTIIWHKPNAMPGSQKDRLTRVYEEIFHFVKNTGNPLLWRNELTGEWVKAKPKQVYYHIETREIRETKPSREERYRIDPSGFKQLVWKPLWRGFDYYYDLDAIREPHKYDGRKDTKYKGGFKDVSIGAHERWPNPLGKNPGNVVLTKHDLAVGRVGNFGYTDPLHVKEYHPKGKNPGDVISLSKHTGTSFESIESIKQRIGDAHKGEATANLYRPHKTHHPVGKNPGDVIQMEASLKFPEGAPRWSIPDFWSIPTRPFKGAHFAVYPEEICIRPILSSCPPNGIVLDPMCGSGTTLLVAKKLGRHYIGIDINEEYVKMARERLAAVPEKLEKWLGK